MRTLSSAFATLALGAAMASALPAHAQEDGEGVRRIAVDMATAGDPIDPMYTFSVGADYAGTNLRPENLAQLRTVADEIGFRYMRFHAIFHDDLGTVKLVDGQYVYDWTKIDELYDAMLGMGIKPFVELGYTPEAMKTSDQTIFYWKGNTSHPQHGPWRDLVDAFVRHLIERYGQEEVRSWYFELWNEPNLDGFWENADQQAYFELYDVTARAIKAIDPQLRVGGPATAGAAWVPEFTAFAHERGLPVDFIATHTYGVDGGFLDEMGHDDNRLSRNPDAVVQDVRKVRQEIAESPYPGIPLFITEWSTSYNPRDPVHDSYISAAYILTKLRGVSGMAQGMSYWAYSDLFEEPGPPPTPFHGGFGLMNREGIRKPAYFAFKYLGELEGGEIATGDTQAMATSEDGGAHVLVWDWQRPEQEESNRPFYTTVLPTADSKPAELRFTGLMPGDYRLTIRRVGLHANDAHTAYLEMGSPDELTPSQLARLQAQAQDEPEREETVSVGEDGSFAVTVPMRANDVVLAELVAVAAE
ncbi:cellulase family glycosylhydrolase [Sphingosinithalassobacter tenebrarum]|uniref:Cellulase family glycosylhydrolase n=2 Tax=Stakelama tenebrarum TaxID=2711215 RepID=A0A6G6YAQ4_9SPHN|nr:cellulase family glycosylhydrolase [Sphingosinithalassobacter tenebrarum]